MNVINYININHPSLSDYKKLIAILPLSAQQQVNSYLLPEDQKRCLAGKLILKKLLVNLGFQEAVLGSIKNDANKRPYIADDIDFNISHSGDYVVVAVSTQSKVGIDIEQINEIDVHAIKGLVLNQEEIEKIEISKKPLHFFYKVWTLKEAALKANGSGLMRSMHDVIIYNTYLQCCNEIWRYDRLNICENYTSHIVYQGDCNFILQQAFDFI